MIKKLVLYISAISTFVLVTVLTFFSFELAAFIIGFTTLIGLMSIEKRRREQWEKSASSKIKALRKNQENLTKTIQRHGDDIIDLKQAAVSATAQETKNSPVKSPANIPVANDDIWNDPDYLSDTVVDELINHAVRNRRVDVFVQPIMRLPQRQMRFYEIFARIRAQAGIYVPAKRYMKLAQKNKAVHDLDYLLLKECLNTIKLTAHIEKAAPFFLNITSSTFKNLSYMKQLLDFLAKNRALAPRLIFEIHQKDFKSISPAVLEIMRGLGKLGCAFSIDHVDTFDFDLKFLQVLKVRFVKIEAQTFLNKAKTDNAPTEIWQTKRKIEGNGIGFIVEKIEDEGMLKELLDFDVSYGQGYLLGKPDLQGAYQQKSQEIKQELKKTA